MKYFSPMLLLLVFSLAGCATQSSLENVNSDMDSIKSRLYTIDRDLANVREESKTNASAIEKGIKADVASVRKMSADIQATIDSTKSEIEALSGKVDDTANAVRKPTEDLARYSEDADKRIIALEEHVLKQQSLIDSLSKRLLEIAEMAKSKKEEVATVPDALYMKGLDSLKVGDVVTAREQFTKFLEQNPKHELAANSQYWIGETHYSEKNYESAILAYQEVIKNYPGKDRVVAAMLKQAMAFNDIKDPKSAKFVLKKLVETFPKSEEANKANAILKEME
jgi:tol-pal system protein YbgF